MVRACQLQRVLLQLSAHVPPRQLNVEGGDLERGVPEDLLDHPQLGAALDGMGAGFYVTSVGVPSSTA